MGNCGLKEANRLSQQAYDTEPSDKTRRDSLITKSQFKFVLDDDDLLISTCCTKSDDHVSSYTRTNRDTRVLDNSCTFTETIENPLDQWVKQLTADEEQDIIFTFSESDTEFQSESELTQQIEGEYHSNNLSPAITARRDPILKPDHKFDHIQSSIAKNTINTNMPKIVMIPPQKLTPSPSTPKPNLYRPAHHGHGDSYSWDSRDMEDLEKEMKHELHRINSLDVAYASPIPQNNPPFLPKRSSNLVQSLACDWDMEVMEMEEDHMRRYLSHLRESVTANSSKL